jgi:hypothetical protein
VTGVAWYLLVSIAAKKRTEGVFVLRTLGLLLKVSSAVTRLSSGGVTRLGFVATAAVSGDIRTRCYLFEARAAPGMSANDLIDCLFLSAFDQPAFQRGDTIIATEDIEADSRNTSSKLSRFALFCHLTRAGGKIMSDSNFERESTFQFPSWRAVGRDAHEQRQRDALTAELQASFGAERSVARGEARPIAALRHAGSGIRASGFQRPNRQDNADHGHATDAPPSAVRNCLPIAIRPRSDEIMPRRNVNTVSRPNLKVCD